MADLNPNGNANESKQAFVGRTFHPLVIPILSLVSGYVIYNYVWLYRRYSEIRQACPDATRISPARAVWFNFIPGFNIFWATYIYYDLARALRRLQQARVGRSLAWPYSIPIVMVGLPFLAGLIISICEPSLPRRLILLLPVVILCQWCGMVITQASLNRVWSTAATSPSSPGQPTDPLWCFYRRQLFGSLACLLPILFGIALVIQEATRIGDFLPAKGTRFGMTLVPVAGASVSDADVQVSIKRLQQRLEALGDASPVVKRSDSPGEIIEVVVPASYDSERVQDLLQVGGVLDLKEVMGGPHVSEAEALTSAGNKIPEGWEILKERGQNGKFYICKHQPLFTGEDIQFARTGQDSYGRPMVSVKLTESAGQRMSTYSVNNIGKNLAIVLDGSVIAAPSIQSEIGRDIQITGQFSPAEVRDLSFVLRAGSGVLPYPGKVVNEQLIPTARWVVRQSVRTGIFALAFVAMVLVFFRVVPGRRVPIQAA